MGNPKQKWTAEEEDALRAGVIKHGAGKWKNIQKDPEFNLLLFSRSNIDLKDKWRNMSVANGQNPREKSRQFKLMANPDAPATPLTVARTPASTDLVVYDTPTDAVMDESQKCILDGKTASKYNNMIVEALSAIQDPNGSDISSLVNFIGQRHDVPPNFRKLLSGRLRRLVGQGKLEKASNGYRITSDVKPIETTPSAPQQKDIIHQQPRPPQTGDIYFCDSLEDAAVDAAYKIADAENKSFVAAEAVKEADRVAEMAEDADSLLQLAKDIFERCSRGEIVMIA